MASGWLWSLGHGSGRSVQLASRTHLSTPDEAATRVRSHLPQPRHMEQLRHTTPDQPETGQQLPPSSHLPDHIILASYCLMTKFPPKLVAQSNSACSQRMWVRNPRAALIWFQFKVSPGISGRTSAEDPVTRRLNCGWRSGFLTGHWQEVSLRARWTVHRSLRHLPNMAPGGSPGQHRRNSQGGTSTPSRPI